MYSARAGGPQGLPAVDGRIGVVLRQEPHPAVAPGQALDRGLVPQQGHHDLPIRCEAVGLKSPSTVHFHLKRLQEQGLIEKGEFKGRAIVLVDPPEKHRIPILGNVAAGSPILAQECIDDYLTFDCGGRPDTFCSISVIGGFVKLLLPIYPDQFIENNNLSSRRGKKPPPMRGPPLSAPAGGMRVRGESMLGAGILPDDLVVVRRQQTASNGEIVVALLGDEAPLEVEVDRGGGLQPHGLADLPHRGGVPLLGDDRFEVVVDLPHPGPGVH